MTDREKVIKGFTCCEIDASCANCPYFDSNTCIADLRNDVFELLKKQPEMLKKRESVTIKKTKEHGFGVYGGICPKCKNWIQSEHSYCGFCGQAVKWE